MLFEIFFTYLIDKIPFEKFEGSTLKRNFSRQINVRLKGKRELGNWHQFESEKKLEKKNKKLWNYSWKRNQVRGGP
jgi:hypothetical protein